MYIRQIRVLLLPIMVAVALVVLCAQAMALEPYKMLRETGEYPQAVAAESDGTVYVLSVDEEAGTTAVKVHEATVDAERASSRTETDADAENNVLVELDLGLDRAYGMTIVDNGAMYVADTVNGRVVKISGFREGEKIYSEELISGLNYPRDVAADVERGFLYVAESGAAGVEDADVSLGKVRKFNINSGAEYTGFSLAQDTGTGLNQPHGLCTDADGNLYVVNIHPVNDGVAEYLIKKYVVDDNGNISGTTPNKVFGQFGTGKENVLAPEDVAVDSRGRIWVADTGNHRVKVFDENGGFLMNVGGYGNGWGRFYTPVKLDIMRDELGDALYVTDSNQERIQVYDIDLDGDATGPEVTLEDIEVVYPGAEIEISGTAIDPESGVNWVGLQYAVFRDGTLASYWGLQYLNKGDGTSYTGEFDTTLIKSAIEGFFLEAGDELRYRLVAVNGMGMKEVSDVSPLRKVTVISIEEWQQMPEPWVNRMWYPVGISSELQSYVVNLFLGMGVARAQYTDDQDKDYYSYFSTLEESGQVDQSGVCEIDQPQPGLAYWVYGPRNEIEDFGDVARYYPHNDASQDDVYRVKLEAGMNMIANPYAEGEDASAYKPILWQRPADGGNVEILRYDFNPLTGLESEGLDGLVDGPYEFGYEETKITVSEYSSFFDSENDSPVTYFRITSYTDDLMFWNGERWIEFNGGSPSYVVVRDKIDTFRISGGAEKTLSAAVQDEWISNNVIKMEGKFTKLSAGDELEPWKGYFVYVSQEVYQKGPWLWFLPDGEVGSRYVEIVNFSRTGCEEPDDDGGSVDRTLAARVILQDPNGRSTIETEEPEDGEDEIVDIQIVVDADDFSGGDFIVKYDSDVLTPYDTVNETEVTEPFVNASLLNNVVEDTLSEDGVRDTGFSVARAILGNSVHVAAVNLTESPDGETVVGTLSFKVNQDTDKAGSVVYVDTEDPEFILMSGTSGVEYDVTGESVYVLMPGGEDGILLVSQSAEFISQVPGYDTVKVEFKPLSSGTYRADVVSAEDTSQVVAVIMQDKYLSSDAGFFSVTWDGKDTAGDPASDGEYKIKISRADDRYADAGELLVPVSMDTTPPEVASVTPQNVMIDSNIMIQIYASDDMAGILSDGMYVIVDSDETVECSGSDSDSVIQLFLCQDNFSLETGKHTFTVNVMDNVGNSADPYQWEVMVYSLNLEDLEVTWNGNWVTVGFPESLSDYLEPPHSWDIREFMSLITDMVIDEKVSGPSEDDLDIVVNFTLNGENFVLQDSVPIRPFLAKKVCFDETECSGCPFRFVVYENPTCEDYSNQTDCNDNQFCGWDTATSMCQYIPPDECDSQVTRGACEATPVCVWDTSEDSCNAKYDCNQNDCFDSLEADTIEGYLHSACDFLTGEYSEPMSLDDGFIITVEKKQEGRSTWNGSRIHFNINQALFTMIHEMSHAFFEDGDTELRLNEGFADFNGALGTGNTIVYQSKRYVWYEHLFSNPNMINSLENMDKDFSYSFKSIFGKLHDIYPDSHKWLYEIMKNFEEGMDYDRVVVPYEVLYKTCEEHISSTDLIEGKTCEKWAASILFSSDENVFNKHQDETFLSDIPLISSVPRPQSGGGYALLYSKSERQEPWVILCDTRFNLSLQDYNYQEIYSRVLDYSDDCTVRKDELVWTHYKKHVLDQDLINDYSGRLRTVIYEPGTPENSSINYLYYPGDGTAEGVFGIITNRDSGEVRLFWKDLDGTNHVSTTSVVNGGFEFDQNLSLLNSSYGDTEIRYYDTPGLKNDEHIFSESFMKAPLSNYVQLTDPTLIDFDNRECASSCLEYVRYGDTALITWTPLTQAEEDQMKEFYGYRIYTEENPISEQNWGKLVTFMPLQKNQDFFTINDISGTPYVRITAIDTTGNEFPITENVQLSEINTGEVVYLNEGFNLWAEYRNSSLDSMEAFLTSVLGEKALEFTSLYDGNMTLLDPENTPVETGIGYWIEIQGINSLPVLQLSGDIPPETTTSYTYSNLRKGWNILHLPESDSFFASVDNRHTITLPDGQETDLMNAVIDGLVEPVFYRFSNIFWLAHGTHFGGTLQDNDTYFFYVHDDCINCSLTINENPAPDPNSFSGIDEHLIFRGWSGDTRSWIILGEVNDTAGGHQSIFGEDIFDTFSAPFYPAASSDKIRIFAEPYYCLEDTDCEGIEKFYSESIPENSMQSIPITVVGEDLSVSYSDGEPSATSYKFLAINTGTSSYDYILTDVSDGNALDVTSFDLFPDDSADLPSGCSQILIPPAVRTTCEIELPRGTTDFKHHYLLTIVNGDVDDIVIAGTVLLENDGASAEKVLSEYINSFNRNAGTLIELTSGSQNIGFAVTDENGFFATRVSLPSGVSSIQADISHQYYIQERATINIPAEATGVYDISSQLSGSSSSPPSYMTLQPGNAEDEPEYTLADGTVVENEARRFSARTGNLTSQNPSIVHGGISGLSVREYPYDTDRMNWHQGQRIYGSETPELNAERRKSDLNFDNKITAADENILLEYIERRCNDVNCRERCVVEAGSTTGCSTDNPDCSIGSSCETMNDGTPMPWYHLDADGDGHVSKMTDSTFIISCYGSVEAECLGADIDETGFINKADLDAFLAYSNDINGNWVFKCHEDKCDHLCLVESGEPCSINSTSSDCHCRLGEDNNGVSWTAADIDGDGSITTSDYTSLLRELKKNTWTTGANPSHEAADVNGDGEVTEADLDIVFLLYGTQHGTIINGNFAWTLCLPASGDLADACDPTPYEYNDPAYVGVDPADEANTELSDREMTLDDDSGAADIDGCLSKCIWGYQNGADPDEWTARQNVRMWHHADVTGDGEINIFDLAFIKDFMHRGSAPRYNPGFERVDYDGDGWVSPDEAQNAINNGKSRCLTIDDCYVCNDSGSQQDCRISTLP